MIRRFHPQKVHDALEEIGGELDQRDRYVMELRYGLYGNKPGTYFSIGIKLDVSKERVKQLETRAERGLKLYYVKADRYSGPHVRL